MSNGQTEKRSWFDRVLRRGKKKVNMLTVDPKTVDTQALVIGGEAVTVFRRAASAGVTLDDKLVDRREAINILLEAKKYDEASALLESYRKDVDASVALKNDAALYVDPPRMTADEIRHAGLLRLSIEQDINALKLDQAGDEIDQLGEVIARAQMRNDLGLERVSELLRAEIEVDPPEGTLPKEQTELETLQGLASKEMSPPLTPEKIESARSLAKNVSKAIEAIERRLETAEADPTNLYERQKLRLNDIIKYPTEYRSAAISKLCFAVDAANMEVQLKLSEYTRAAEGKPRDNAATAARTAISALRQKIDEVVKPLREHDAEVRKFFSALKRTTAQINIADTLPQVDGGSSTPWRAERQAYDVSRAQVVKLQDERKFREANIELGNCVTLMKALFDKRRLSIDADITGVGNSEAKAHQLANSLDAKGLLKLLTPQQQIDLLKALPASDNNKAARIKILANSSLDPAFVQAEAAVLKDVVAKLRGDDGKNATDESREAKRQWKEAEDNWEVWAKGDPGATPPKAADPAKIQAVFERMALMQFKELCKLAGFAKPEDYPPGFPNPPVTVKLEDKPPNIFGDTTPVFPAVIAINKNHRMFGDFKEMMDTILHENAHAWQNMIVAQFKKEPPFRDQDQAKLKGDTALPAMKLQAQLFTENDGSYFNSDDSREAYRHEPLEEQAWGFGGKSSAQLLVPPPQRSFDSSKGLKNKFWVVQSLTRSASARVRLRERHGIYIDEWEGETAGDKKLTLEGVAGLSSTQLLKVIDVVNEFTLELDLDASGLRGRMVDMSEVRQEMLALAKVLHPGKKLDELTDPERKDLFDKVVLDEGWVSSGGNDDRTAVVRATDEVDVEHARLVLDETVTKLT